MFGEASDERAKQPGQSARAMALGLRGAVGFGRRLSGRFRCVYNFDVARLFALFERELVVAEVERFGLSVMTD